MMHWVNEKASAKEDGASYAGWFLLAVGGVLCLLFLSIGLMVSEPDSSNEPSEATASPTETSDYGTLPYQAVEWASIRIAEYAEADELPFSEVWNRLEPSLADSGVTATVSGMNGLPASYEEYCLTADDGETSAFYSSEDSLIVEGVTGDSYACGSWR